MGKKNLSKGGKQKRKEERKKKRKERRKKIREKLKGKLTIPVLIPFKLLMRKLVKKKGQTPSKDIKILANQVYELYLKKHFEDGVAASYSLSGDAVNHVIPPIPPELIPVVIDFITGMIKKKKEQGTTGDAELDKELDKVEEKNKELEEKEKEKPAGGFFSGNTMIFAGLFIVILIFAAKFFFKSGKE